MAAGPLGEVAISAFDNLHEPGGLAEVFVVAPSGGAGAGASRTFTSNGGAYGLLAFDPQGGLLYGWGVPGPYPGGFDSGFVVGPASVSLNVVNGEACACDLPDVTVGSSMLGRDTAGDSFAAVTVTPWCCSTGTYDFGGGAVSGSYLIEYSPTGAFVRQIPTPPGTLAVGALGDLFAASQVTGTMDYGCGPVGTASVTSTVLAKLDQTGACLWSEALPTGTSFALDPLENVLLATTFTGTVSFGGAPLTSVGTSDLALAKLAPTGALLWSESFGGSGASVSGITVLGATNTGGLALSVGINGATDFGCGAVGSSPGATTLFARFDATGAVVYSRVVQLASGQSMFGPVVDGLGGISVAVNMGTAPDFEPSTLQSILVSHFAP